MKGLVSVFVGLSFVPGALWAAGEYDKNMYGDLNLRYYEPRTTKNDAGIVYGGMHADLSLLSWDNEYNDQSGARLGSDSFNFKPVIGFDIFVGYKSDNNWRADLELGYIGKYSEMETEYYSNAERTDFDLETFYLSMNGYYDFKYGLYVGAGVGSAVVETSVYSDTVAGDCETKVSPFGAVMLGWTYNLDAKMALDIRYRLAAFDAGTLTIPTGVGTWVKVNAGIVSDNSLSVGLRYYF